MLGSCNKDIVPENEEMLIELVIDRLKRLGSMDISSLTPQELVALNLTDPVRVFVKDEPHSLRKRQQKRWRLIFCVSLVDQLVERLLCGAQNSAEIRSWQTLPSAPGMGLTLDEDLRHIHARMMDLSGGRPMAEADITGFDWSVKEWELLLDAEVRVRLGNMTGFIANALRNRVLCVSRSVYAMPDGELLVSTPGVQLSGSYNTSSTNSRIRVMLAYLAGASWAVAMGDDCVEEFVPEAPERYAALGHKLKMYTRREDSFSFCSTWFTPGGAWPEDGTKTLYRLLEQKRITPELLAQFKREMRHSPRYNEFLSSVRRVMSSGGKGGAN